MEVGDRRSEAFVVWIYGIGGRFCVFAPNLEPICGLKSSEVRSAISVSSSKLGASCRSEVRKRSPSHGVSRWTQRVWREPSF